MGLKIEKIDRILGEEKRDNFFYASYLDTNDEWIQRRTGIVQRRITKKRPSELAMEVSRQLMLHQEEKEEVAALFVTGLSQDLVMPSVAAKIHGIKALHPHVFCMDLNMACTGYVGALILAEKYLQEGQLALIVTTEVLSAYVDNSDRSSAILFGDGATASLVRKNGEPFYYDISAFPSDALFMVREEFGGDGKIRMEGQEVFRFATSEIPKSIQKVRSRVPSVDWYLLHQANARITKSVSRHFPGEEHKFYENIASFGNTSSSSIPLALFELRERERNGSALLCGFGAGLTIATAAVTL